MHPDFSGEWILNREASTLSPGADGMRSDTWTIDHRDPTFGIKARFVTDSAPIEWQFELLADGREVVATHQGSTIASLLRWEGDTLAVTMRIQRSEERR